jgi:predicted DNA-binding transcriptional regulator AlpA
MDTKNPAAKTSPSPKTESGFDQPAKATPANPACPTCNCAALMTTVISTLNHLETLVKNIAVKIDFDNNNTCKSPNIPTKTAMKILGYKDKNAFLEMTARENLTRIRLHARRFLWVRGEIEAALEQKTNNHGRRGQYATR